MAQGSIPWDDQQGGDGNPGAAIYESSYSAAEWHRFFSRVFGSEATAGFIDAGIGGEFNVTERGVGANMSVDVASGSSFVDGAHHYSDATENLAIAAADPANPRLDRVILRVTRGATQTVRLAVLTGVAAAAPALPALTQTAALFEIDVAHVYVRAATASILDEDISDKRIFAPNMFSSSSLLNNNLIVNSEFMAFSWLDATAGGASGYTQPPDYWDLVLTPSNIIGSTKPSQMERGRAVQITADAANEGISQTFAVLASTQYVIKSLIYITAGDVGKIVVTTDSAAPGTITREIRRTGAWLTETIHYTTEADATLMTVQFLCNANTDIIRVGQCIVACGYIPGQFRAVHETLPFVQAHLTDSAWNGDVYAGGTTQTIDLRAQFGAIVLDGTSAIQLLIGVDANAANGISVDGAGPGIHRIAKVKTWINAQINYGSVLVGLVQRRYFYMYIDNANVNSYLYITGIVT